MISDLNKGITSITYNHLNLPVSVKINNGSANNGTISYIYAANGVKLKKMVSGTSTGTTEYAGNYIYENGALQFFNTPEGYVTSDNQGGFDYVYQYKDHLGNVRLSFTDTNGTLEIVKENNYYPFGLQHKGYNGNVSSLGNSVAKKYMFGGKEYQDELNLAWYDVSARNYDPALGRWMNVDPLAEQMRRHSPYNFAFNNPLRYTDPDGMAPDDIIIKGDDKFKQKALENLQALTAETLELDNNGKVVITGCGGSDNCGAGTDLVSDLVNSDKIVTIVETDGANQTLAENGYALQNKDGTLGKGSNSIVEFNPEKTEGGVDMNGNKERPTEIGLGHELDHARDFAQGTADPNLTDPKVLDPDSLKKGKINQLNNLELNARKFENELRKERNLPARQLIGKMKKGVKYEY